MELGRNVTFRIRLLSNHALILNVNCTLWRLLRMIIIQKFSCNTRQEYRYRENSVRLWEDGIQLHLRRKFHVNLTNVGIVQQSFSLILKIHFCGPLRLVYLNIKEKLRWKGFNQSRKNFLIIKNHIKNSKNFISIFFQFWNRTIIDSCHHSKYHPLFLIIFLNIVK